MLFIIVLNGIWVLAKGIHFVFLLEKKNYRLNRFQATIHDRGFFLLFYSLKIHFPSRSLRNILLLAFHAITTLTIFLYAFENIYVYDFLSYFFWLAPFVSFAIVITGVQITAVPATIYQWCIMQLAARQVKRSKATFIAVTGSYGKSEVVYFLKQLLSIRYHVGTTIENMNTEMGIARSILNQLKKNTDFFIVEAATYRQGNIAHSTHYIPFKTAVVTGIGNQHRDLFASRESLVAEECTIIERLKEDSTAYVNYDIPELTKISSKMSARTIPYGTTGKAAIFSTDLEHKHTGITARVRYMKSFVTIRSRLLGRSTLYNLMPAIGIALDSGIPASEIAAKIVSLRAREGRLSTHMNKKRAMIIQDRADVSVESVLNACDILRRFHQKKRILVMQGLIELGVEKRDSYKRIIDEIVSIHAQVFIVDPYAKEMSKKANVITFNDVSSLQKELLLSVDTSTVMIILGIFPSSFIESVLR
ncbi:hypothetical protein KBD81_06195 [Candidatus Woesebacteria bacterium]|nr:hypothetical protein [Candidatus Woesebacteria bacterium]